MDPIVNHLLFEQKVGLIEKFENNFESYIFTNVFLCNYHGISLKFHTQSEKLKDALFSFLPKNWQNINESQYEIYLLDPSVFGYKLENWCDEASQNCVSQKENHLAIQRDFVAWNLNEKKILLICEENVCDGFYNFLRWFISERLIHFKKYVVHASCVLDKNEEAHIFYGHSGAGKTTMTKLGFPRLSLGDDMNIISLAGKDLMVEAGAIGGLFNSMIGYDKKIKVKACYWLHQANENKIEKLSIPSANQKLVASFANLNWPTLPTSLSDNLIEFAAVAVSVTPFYEVYFKKDTSIWDILDP